MVLWHEDAYTRTDENGDPLSFERYKQREGEQHGGRWSFMSKSDAQIYSVTGVGFFLDSYDLFIINLVNPIWTYEYWGGLQGKTPHYPPLLRGLVNSSANIGNIFGQLTFGLLGDIFGRRYVYGNELIIGTIGLILVISLPNSIPTAKLKMIWVFCWRILLGIGIGGDYPMSASIMAERSHLKRRGQMLGWIFSNQGWGNLAGSIVTLIILACFTTALNQDSKYGQLDGVWRLQMGVALIPALATLWPRLHMPEGKKYLESRELNTPRRPDSTRSRFSCTSNHKPRRSSMELIVSDGRDLQAKVNAARAEIEAHGRHANVDIFFTYFSEWRHLKILLGTMSCWFLLDVAFFGTNLNQSVILEAIGYSTGGNQYDKLKRNAIGNLIIAVAGYVPGYFFTIFFIEKLGRRWIQIQGFLICALLFAVIAGGYEHMGTAGKFVCLALTQFFFNFGPNSTTFIIPAEIFPTRVRGFAHGTSAAAGKLGAILSALLFNYLSSPDKIGLANVLWIFFACNLLGAGLTWWLVPETRWKDADVWDYEDWFETHVLQRRG
ncbi:MAG: hypothetical protein Q9217_002936 [Psora testacea]